MSRPVFLVGSVPFKDTEEVFTRCAETLGPYAKRFPDGERGGWLPAEDFRKTRGLVEGRGQSLLNPPITRTVRLQEGVKAIGSSSKRCTTFRMRWRLSRFSRA